MEKIRIEFEDKLEEYIEKAWEETEKAVINWCKENNIKEFSEMPSLGDVEEIYNIILKATPSYTSEIRGLWYLYWDAFVDAYKEAGIGENPIDNGGMNAIFFYIGREVTRKYLKEKRNIFTKLVGLKNIREGK